jgi:hypothetical protein
MANATTSPKMTLKAVDLSERQEAIPPLENGDRLTRHEFERRYLSMPGVKKAELIEGRVYMPSPVRLKHHGFPHTYFSGWALLYHAKVPQVLIGDNSTSRLDLDNEPQPDLMMLLPEAAGGQTKLVDDYVEGAPELVVEVSASTTSIDLNDKLNAYRRNGVREYIVLRVRDHVLDWFELQGSDYVRREPDEAGLIKSNVFPGLWLDVRAVMNRDAANMLAAVEAGCQTDEHKAFADRLATLDAR